MRILNFMRSRAAQAASAVLVLAAIALPVSQAVFAADTPNCDSNAVVWGGASSTCSAGNYTKATLIARIQGGDGHNSAANIQGIYNGFLGTTTSQLVDDINNAQVGTVTKSGDVIVGGKTVASNVWTAGRINFGNSVPMHGVFMRPPSVSFLSDQLSAFVIMNGNTFVGAIIQSCGNPVFTINKPFGIIFKRVVLADGSNTAAQTQDKAVQEPVGSSFSYNISLINRGTAPMNNVVLTDNLPAGLTLADGSGSHFTVTVDSIPANNHHEVQIPVKITSTTAGQCINNVASFTANDNQSGQDNAWICLTGGHGGTPTPTPTQTPTPTPTCQPSQSMQNGVCVNNCTVNQHQENGTCVNNCSANQTEQNGQCVTTETCTTNCNLPQTGAEAGLAGIGGMGAMGYAARAYLRSKKSLLDQLRRK